MLHFPSSPNVDDIYEGPNIRWRWDGARWVRLGGGGAGGAGVSVGEFPPANPKEGDLWFDAVEGQLYIWFNDGSSSQWVVTINQGVGGGAGPSGPQMGVTDGSNAAPGEVGEYIRATGSVMISTGSFSPAEITLPPGDWDVISAQSWTLQWTATASPGDPLIFRWFVSMNMTSVSGFPDLNNYLAASAIPNISLNSSQQTTGATKTLFAGPVRVSLNAARTFTQQASYNSTYMPALTYGFVTALVAARRAR